MVVQAGGTRVGRGIEVVQAGVWSFEKVVVRVLQQHLDPGVCFYLQFVHQLQNVCSTSQCNDSCRRVVQLFLW